MIIPVTITGTDIDGVPNLGGVDAVGIKILLTVGEDVSDVLVSLDDIVAIEFDGEDPKKDEELDGNFVNIGDGTAVVVAFNVIDDCGIEIETAGDELGILDRLADINAVGIAVSVAEVDGRKIETTGEKLIDSDESVLDNVGVDVSVFEGRAEVLIDSDQVGDIGKVD